MTERGAILVPQVGRSWGTCHMSESDSTPTTSKSEIMSSQDPQILVDSEVESSDDSDTQTVSDQSTPTPAGHGAQADARTPPGSLMEGIGKWLYGFSPYKLRIK